MVCNHSHVQKPSTSKSSFFVVVVSKSERISNVYCICSVISVHNLCTKYSLITEVAGRIYDCCITMYKGVLMYHKYVKR